MFCSRSVICQDFAHCSIIKHAGRLLQLSAVFSKQSTSLSDSIQGQFCDYCNSVDPSKARPVTNAIDGTERWWQSPPLSRGPGYNEVNVTLDLGQVRLKYLDLL